MLTNLLIRSKLLRALREYFYAEGFIEVETPVRIAAPAPEPNIICPSCGAGFLRASPELQMKKLLAHGAEKIFQIGPCFREGERGRRHNPEFTMLEWYRRGADYEVILEDAIKIVKLAAELAPEDVVCGGRPIREAAHSLLTLPVRDAYRRWAKWDPMVDWDADKFDTDMVMEIEAKLPADRIFVLKDYPRQAASLARLKAQARFSEEEKKSAAKETSATEIIYLAQRWELYFGGMELANAFTELTWGAEQRRRFSAALREMATIGQPLYPLDEEFLGLLERGEFPASSGAALGIDRLAMLVCGAAEIRKVRAP